MKSEINGMNTRHNELKKWEDASSLNYIVASRLKQFARKQVADNFSIKSVTKGVEQYTINGIMHEVVRNNFLIVNPGQEVALEVDHASAVKGTCFFLDAKLVEQIQFSSAHSVDANLDQIDPDLAQITFSNIPIHAFHTALNQFLQGSVAYEEWTSHQLKDFLILIAEKLVQHQYHTISQLDQLEGTKTVTRHELYKRIQQGRQYIHDNYSASIALSEMAKACNLSEYYFHRNFRQYFQLTPHQYLTIIRMKQAKSFLDSGKYSKKEVALKCGFQDQKYFHKAYKKWERSLS